MDEIVFFSTTSSLTRTINSVQKKMDTSWPVYEDLMVQALKIAKKKIGEGTKVIISRGGTAEYLRQNLSVPVVNIRHGFYDIHPAVQQARSYSDKIGVIGFDSLCVAAEDYKQVMECSDMYIEQIGQYSQYEKKIREMRSRGVGAIIGGLGLRKFEGAYGFRFVAGGGSEYSVRDAINEALEQLRVDRERSQQDRILDAVINSTFEGIVGFRSDGQIIHINHVAKRLLNYDAQETIQELFPELFRGNEKEKMRSLPAIDAMSEKLVKHGERMLALNTAPIIVDGQRIGTVVTIQEQDYIQTMDRKIRKELVGRGHVAKKSFEDIIGNSSRMEEVKRIAKRYAESNSTILITGETGVGKEVFAQSIHNYSARKKKPFVAVNCAALPHDILESELFGYVKGAFTGARGEGKLGIFELAHTGTVFLDEISELPMDMQAKLLRVLQEREIMRVGDDRTIPVDIRIIAACNSDLSECVRNKTFRNDLFYRIAVLELSLPPLRERPEDIPDLIWQEVRNRNLHVKEIEPRALERLCSYDWPGNIRQLINIMERLDILCEDGIVTERSVKAVLTEHGAGMPLDGGGSWLEHHQGNLLSAAEDELIQTVLRIVDGNRERAAAILGISPTTLWRKMKEN